MQIFTNRDLKGSFFVRKIIKRGVPRFRIILFSPEDSLLMAENLNVPYSFSLSM